MCPPLVIDPMTHRTMSGCSTMKLHVELRWLHSTTMWSTTRVHWQHSHWVGGSLFKVTGMTQDHLLLSALPVQRPVLQDCLQALHYNEARTSLDWGSILHGVNQLSYFSFQPVLHDWCNKGCGMCCPVCGMLHIKEPLLLIGNSSLCFLSHYQIGP